MSSKKSFEQFVQDMIQKIGDFDSGNHNQIKEIIRKAIDYYDLKTVERVEEVGNKRIETLYLASMAEENMLLKLARIASGNENGIGLEVIYDSSVVRKH
ncbi:DUF6407 family protein [Halalkalibacter alkaliphilus]|uniref:DUF6407 family protein n=1 Tax=Halalkalibacter alkaliphilus TaxID=2917993 RepID=A0A9X2CV76_9BACI|nr:DUF6407 family protein [Halalkalibacter alkaliphilus]